MWVGDTGYFFSIPLLSVTLNDHSQSQSFVDAHTHTHVCKLTVVAVGRWHRSASLRSCGVAATCLHRARRLSSDAIIFVSVQPAKTLLS